MSQGYNGWANYETWNIVLWLSNDEGLYNIAKQYSKLSGSNPYEQLCENLEEFGYTCTADGVFLNDENLNLDEINDAIREL